MLTPDEYKDVYFWGFIAIEMLQNNQKPIIFKEPDKTKLTQWELEVGNGSLDFLHKEDIVRNKYYRVGFC